MRHRALLMLGVAAVLGVTAVLLMRGLIDRHEPVPTAARTVVVANVALDFGTTLSSNNLIAVPWPLGIVPDGAFGSVDAMLPKGVKRVALQAIAKGEPVLKNMISGFGGRATLSAVISPGMRAMTIRVNEVLGVAGFVLPGDRVDVLLTQRANPNKPTTDVLLQNIRVLGVDQDTSKKTDKPTVARAVTLEVTPEQAEKVSLASTVGTLSLALRNAASADVAAVAPVGLRDLGAQAPVKAEGGPPFAAETSIRILRGTKATDYELRDRNAAVNHSPQS